MGLDKPSGRLVHETYPSLFWQTYYQIQTEPLCSWRNGVAIIVDLKGAGLSNIGIFLILMLIHQSLLSYLGFYLILCEILVPKEERFIPPCRVLSLSVFVLYPLFSDLLIIIIYILNQYFNSFDYWIHDGGEWKLGSQCSPHCRQNSLAKEVIRKN